MTNKKTINGSGLPWLQSGQIIVTICLGCLCLMTTSCGLFVQNQSSLSPPQPSGSKIYENDLTYTQKTCAMAARCLSYTLTWPEKTRVKIEYKPFDFDGVLFVNGKQIRVDQTGVATYTRTTTKETSLRISVAGRYSRDYGPYSLKVSPPPSNEKILPRPAPTKEELERRRLAKLAEQQQELDQFIAENTEGLTLEGKAIDVQVEKRPKIVRRAKRFKCYSILYTIPTDVELDRRWSPPGIQVRWPGQEMNSGTDKTTRKSRRAFMSNEICPFRNGKVVIDFTRFSYTPYDAKGTINIKIYSHKIARKALIRMEREDRQSWNEGGCATCSEDRTACHASGRGNCATEFRRCLREMGVPISQCQY